MALYLQNIDGSSVIRERLVNGSFGYIPLRQAIELCRADVFKESHERTFSLRILTEEERP